MASIRLAFAVAVASACSSDPDPQAVPDAATSPDAPSLSRTCPPSVTIAHDGTAIVAPSLHFLDPATYPSAICNDSTPAVYLLRPGTGSAGHRWVIDLEGGGACYDATLCPTRAHGHLVSSTPWRSATPQDLAAETVGILSPSADVNPDFYDATLVKVFYCSSDAWSGAKMAVTTPFSGTDTATWIFQGRAIVAAVVDELTKLRGMDSATEILFLGNSAGSAGMYLNVNDVLHLVPQAARFAAFGDAAFEIDVTGFDPDAPPDYTSTDVPSRADAIAIAMTVWGGHGETVCDAAATTAEQKVACYSPPTALASGAIGLPILVAQTQKDSVQIGNNGVPDDAPREQAQGYAGYFRTQMRAALAAMPAPISEYSPDTTGHTEATGDGIFAMTHDFAEGPISLRDAVAAWYRDPCTAKRWIAP